MLMRMWEHVLLERHLGHHLVDRRSFLQLPNVDTEKSRPFSFLKQFTESPARSTQEFFCILNSIEQVACHMNLEREREKAWVQWYVLSQYLLQEKPPGQSGAHQPKASCENPHHLRKLPNHHTKESWLSDNVNKGQYIYNCSGPAEGEWCIWFDGWFNLWWPVNFVQYTYSRTTMSSTAMWRLNINTHGCRTIMVAK